MTEAVANERDRARKALRAAQLLLCEQLHEDAVSRSFYAVLHAADALVHSADDCVRRMREYIDLQQHPGPQ